MPQYHSPGHPSNLKTYCIHCKGNIPYSPLAAQNLCASCENMATASDRAVSVASEDEEDFVDAQEEIAPTNDERDDDESSVTETGVGREFRGEDMDLDGEEAGPEEMEVDLFESTFGQTKAEESCVEDEIATISTRFVAAEHTKGCTSIRGPPTPTPDSSNFDTASAQALERCDHPPPNPIKDRSWALRRLTRFHDRAKDLIPRLPLPAHRYWIGVLHMGKNPDIFKVEKDFLWLKGNRFSTVQTVRIPPLPIHSLRANHISDLAHVPAEHSRRQVRLAARTRDSGF